MSTSTCTPLGGGSSQCVYQYRKEISTTTQSTPTTTQNFEVISTIQSVLFIGVMSAVIIVYLVRKLT